MAPRRYWLMKSEPDVFSFDDLWRAAGRKTAWDGVRNYQARNFMRDDMRPGDGVLYYHSNADPAGVAGLAEVAGPARPDPTQFDPADPHFDPEARREDPRWYLVDVRAVAALPRLVSLQELKAAPELERMGVCRRGNRLSVMPVTQAEFDFVRRLASRPARPGGGETASGGATRSRRPGRHA
jgi:predicted RNA-binding protein with PUA-like domain